MADDEPDWESPEPDPPSPGPDPPSVDRPEKGLAEAAEDADSETVRLFWRLVLVVDVGVLALALGPMLVYFEGDWRRGTALFVFGVAVLAYGVVRYRRSDVAGGDSDDGGPGDASEPKG